VDESGDQKGSYAVSFPGRMRRLEDRTCLSSIRFTVRTGIHGCSKAQHRPAVDESSLGCRAIVFRRSAGSVNARGNEANMVGRVENGPLLFENGRVTKRQRERVRPVVQVN